MKLKSFGCSFVFGNDLPDDGRDMRHATPSRMTWPALIARHLGYDYQCLARPGSGNLQIMEKIMNQISDPDPAVFVIGWTWIDRFDYTVEKDQWKTIMPIDTDDRAKFYYRDLHSQYRDKLTTLSAINTVIDALEQASIPCIMTYMDDLMFETEWHASPAILTMQQRAKPYMTRFQEQSFLEWSRSQGFEISETWHPLAPAHRAAADLLIPNLNDAIRHKV